eukprot:2924324-Prymnesium_polylepis.2
MLTVVALPKASSSGLACKMRVASVASNLRSGRARQTKYEMAILMDSVLPAPLSPETIKL